MLASEGKEVLSNSWNQSERSLAGAQIDMDLSDVMTEREKERKRKGETKKMYNWTKRKCLWEMCQRINWRGNWKEVFND